VITMWDVHMRRFGVVTVKAPDEATAVAAAREALYSGAVELTGWDFVPVPHAWSQPPRERSS
jgi:hypothetical protein